MTFVATSTDQKPRLAALRSAMANSDISGFLIPRTDQYQNEYIPDCAQRLAWLTGFTGSAGLGIALHNKAAVFVDGRYTVQVQQQIDTTNWDGIHSAEQAPSHWLQNNVTENQRIGFDPWLHTRAEVQKLSTAIEKAGGSLVPVLGSE